MTVDRCLDRGANTCALYKTRISTLSDIPVPDADINEIGCFALTFDGYEHWGAFEKCAEVANAERQNTLTDLRTCLFFEQRRWRHSGYGPDEEAEASGGASSRRLGLA